MIDYKKEQIEKLSSKIDNIKDLVETICLSDFNKTAKKQILVDISGIINFDPKTGISRVVKSQFIKLYELNQNLYKIKAVYLKKINENYYYFYANSYMKNILKLDIKNSQDSQIVLNKDDIFYISDLSSQTIQLALNEKVYEKYKYLGVKIVFLVYDLLPIKYPHFFRENQDKIHQKWLEDISSISSYFITISNSVAKDLKNWLNSYNPNNDAIIKTIHLGADFPSIDISFFETKTYIASQNINFLVVSTIEPRKAHKQLLEAFEILWKTNKNINLHIVGKKGWLVDKLISKIQNHQFLNKLLFYYDFVDDKQLKDLYKNSDALIVPSYDEGFGLPIIEAAFYKKPIITRDIEVFHEVATTHAFYFKNTQNPKDISDALTHWIKLYKENSHPKSDYLKSLSWENNAKITFDYLSSL
jgi:glycosyltransferase involved in cell wall biosynthesis